MAKFTAKHAERLAEILEDHGWHIYNDGEYCCPECGDVLNGGEFRLYRYCPMCGYKFKEGEPKRDEGRMAATHDFLADCVIAAMGKRNG